MKIRHGFVSNSSSSSFTCEICGETKSGYDCSRSDLGMEGCKNDHTFCQSYVVADSLTVEEKRALLIGNISSYWKGAERQAKIDAFANMSPDEVETAFENADGDDGVWPCHCPICTFSEISMNERDLYLLRKAGKTWKEIEEQIKKEFSSYDDFQKFLHPPKE